jgi:hypothetical protein
MPTATEQRFSNEGAQIGSVFVMKPDSAISFVQYCKQSEVEVYGVEGFLRVGDGIQPQQEHSCDYDSPSEDGHSLTISFLKERLESELWFEVVTDETPN